MIFLVINRLILVRTRLGEWLRLALCNDGMT